MRIGRFLAGASAVTITALVLAPGVASAHTANVTHSCDGLTITVFLYPEGVTTYVTIDDGPTTSRSGPGQWTVPWNRLEDHSYRVVVDGADGVQYDHEFEDTQDACPVTTTTAPGVTTTTAPGVTTTTAPGVTTTTAPGSVTTTTAPGSVGGVAGTVPRGSSGTGAGAALPATGPASAPIVAVGSVALVAGLALLLASRRRSAG